MSRIYILLGVAIALICGGIMAYNYIYNEGVSDINNQITRRECDALVTATKIRAGVRHCNNLGRMYDNTTGECL